MMVSRRRNAYGVRVVEERDEWTRLVAGHSHAVAHRFGYQQAVAIASGVTPHLLVVEGPAGRSVCPVAVRSWQGYEDVYTPYGFAGFVGDLDEQLIQQTLRAREDNDWVAGYFQQHPVVGRCSDSSSGGPVTYIVDLEGPWAAVCQRMSSRLRSKLRQWNRSAARIRDVDALRAAFVALYPEHMARAGAARVYDFGRTALSALVALPEIRLYGAGSNAVEAVVAFGVTADSADYLFGVSTPAGRYHIAGLVAWALEDAARNGVRRANLGGGVRAGDGVAEFKRRFGAKTVVAPAWSWVFNDERYQWLCRQAGVNPKSADYFPAYRARR